MNRLWHFIVAFILIVILVFLFSIIVASAESTGPYLQVFEPGNVAIRWEGVPAMACSNKVMWATLSISGNGKQEWAYVPALLKCDPDEPRELTWKWDWIPPDNYSIYRPVHGMVLPDTEIYIPEMSWGVEKIFLPLAWR